MKKGSVLASYLKCILIIFSLSLYFLSSGYAATLEVTLQWDASINLPDVASQKIYYDTDGLEPYTPSSNFVTDYSLNGGISWLPISGISPYPFTIGKDLTQISLRLSDDTNIYYFRLKAVHTNGLESDYSNQAVYPIGILVDNNQTSLVRKPLIPNSVVLTGVGSSPGYYQWELTGVGSFSSSSIVTNYNGDNVTFYAPTTISGDYETASVSLTNTNDPSLTGTVVITVYNPDKLLVITSAPQNLIAGESGSITVQVQTLGGTPVTAGEFTLNLSSDSTGAYYFYETGTTNAITSITIPDGQSNATFDYNDSDEGTPTITISTTGLNSASQKLNILPAPAKYMTLSSSKTQLVSDQNDTALLTATLYDQFGNPASDDNSTLINFSLTDSTYLDLSSSSATVSSGIATVSLTTKAGMVTNPPATSSVNISSPGITSPSGVSLTIINFHINVENDKNHLVRNPLSPSSVNLTGIGGSPGNYHWQLTGVGSFSGSSTVTTSDADNVIFYAPNIISGDSQTTTITMSDAADPSITDTVTLTVYNPAKLVITSDKLIKNAGVSGTVTVNVQTSIGTPISTGEFLLDLSTNSSGQAHFYSSGTTNEITNIIVPDGISSVTLDYNDEKVGTPTITVSTTGLNSASQQENIVPASADYMTLSASKTELTSNQLDTATLTATLFDIFDNLSTNNNSTIITFSLTDSTYLTLSSSSAQVNSGSASVTVTTKAGPISNLPANVGVNITSGTITPPEANPDVTLTVNKGLGINVKGDQTALMTQGYLPDSVELTGVGASAGNYQWEISGNGSLSSTTGDFVTYYSPSSINGNSETVTVTLTDGDAPEQTDSVTLTIYQPIIIANKPSTVLTVQPGSSTPSYTVSGGDNSFYTWQVRDNSGNIIDTQSGSSYIFTAPSTGNFAGVYTITVYDTNDFADSFQVKVPFLITPEKSAFTELDYSGDPNPQLFTVSGGGTTFTWEILEYKNATNPVASPSTYGSWSKNSPVQNSNTNTFNPANVTEEKEFYIRVTIDNDPDQTSVAGPFTIIPVGTYTVTLSDNEGAINGSGLNDGNLTVMVMFEETDDTQTKSLESTDGTVTFILPDISSTFEYIVMDNRDPSVYGNKTVSSESKYLTIILDKIGGNSLTGTVQDATGTEIQNVRITAYQPSDPSIKYESLTNLIGKYTVVLPSGASQNGWTITASHGAYDSVSQEQKPIGIVDFTGYYSLHRKTTIPTVNTKITDNSVKIDFVAPSGVTSADQVNVVVTSGNSDLLGPITLSNGSLSFTYNSVEDFTISIKAISGDGYSVSRDFRYFSQEASTVSAQGETDTGGGSVDLTSTGGQPAKVVVKAGGLTKNATIIMNQIPKTQNTQYTAGSPDYIYEVLAIDSTTGNEMTNENINRIEITLPVDLSIVEPGDLEDGIATIYYADNLEIIEAGNGSKVPVGQIISTNYVGTNLIGSVRFWVDHFTIFSIGTTRTITDDTSDNDTPPSNNGGSSGDGGGSSGGSDGGGGGCFIDALKN